MPEPANAQMHAVWSSQPVVIDGQLDDPVWQTAPAYALTLSRDRADKGDAVQEFGQVQLAYDDDCLYVAFHFVDSDVVQESDEDQQHHYRTGDVAELFLKPERETWCWEFFATPNSRRTAFFFPSDGRFGLPSCFQYQSTLRVGAQVQGTLNEWRDRDEGWTAEMAIPRAELAAQGVPLSPDHPWRILVGRYNYSRYLDEVELSMHPTLSITDYHQTDEYASLVLDPPDRDQE